MSRLALAIWGKGKGKKREGRKSKREKDEARKQGKREGAQRLACSAKRKALRFLQIFFCSI